MIFSVDTWLLPAIAASSSSYLVCLAWERLRNQTAPSGLLAAFLAGLSFLMGAISSYYRSRLFSQSLENNVIIMFIVGASTTYLWLLLRKYLPGFGRRDD
jgi:predicted Na+-dependent transporter